MFSSMERNIKDFADALTEMKVDKLEDELLSVQ